MLALLRAEMRWIRLLSLGLASVYPLYWTAQFVLFFLPECVVAFWVGRPVRVIGISYLQATCTASPHQVFAAQWEALVAAGLFTGLIVLLRGDRYLTGALGIVLLGQSALLPFVKYLREPSAAIADGIAGGFLTFVVIVFGLSRILRRIGGTSFVDRLALLNLLAVLPQAALWLAFRASYPFFGTRFLLLLLLPVYLGALVAAALPPKIDEADFSNVRWTEVLASSAAAGLLILAITLSSRSIDGLSSGLPADRLNRSSTGFTRLAGRAAGMLT